MSGTMFASRLHRVGERLRVDQVPIPDVAPEEALIEVKASGICHSDLNYRNGIAPVRKLPLTLGHEIAGTVAKIGSKVTGLRHGDQVVVHYVISCGKCAYCKNGQENYCAEYQMIGKDLDGGFAEFVKVPAHSIIKLTKQMPFEEAAIMGCAVPTAYHALKRGRVRRGDTVVVFGVGGLGIHAVQLASRVLKAGLVIAVDVHDWKLDLARQFGAKETVNASNHDSVNAIRDVTDGKFGDVVLDFVGSVSTIQKGIDSTGKGGRMVLVGIGAKSTQVYPYATLIGKEMEIIGVDDHLKTELVDLVKLVRTGRINLSQSVTHRVPLDDVDQGLELLEANQPRVLRVVAVQ
jgi:2-desacetyl-2-hydroxyethyl bacteriochlorophyllide A dehydrogenase